MEILLVINILILCAAVGLLIFVLYIVWQSFIGPDYSVKDYYNSRYKADKYMTMEESLGVASDNIGKLGNEMEYDYDINKYDNPPIDMGTP